MTPQDLLQELEAGGVRLSVRGDMLSFSAPQGALTPARIALMRRHKADLVRLVSDRAQVASQSVERYAATLGQESLWFLHHEDPAGASYNTAAALRIRSPLDVDALRRALDALQTRHESLRTSFALRDGTLYGEIHPEPCGDVRVIDATALDEGRLHALCHAEYAAPFDLARGPLFRVRVLSRSPADHVLLLVVHHIVFDAASLWILQRELQLLYAAEAAGQPGLLTAAPAPFREFAGWQREFVASAAGERQWHGWQARLAGDVPPGEICWTFDRPRRGSRRGATLTSPLGADAAAALRGLARDLGVTRFVVGLAAFQALVHRTGGQRDFIVGTTTSGRTRREFAATIGYFVNTLPLRTGIADGMTFADLVCQAKRSVFEALEVGDYPFAQLVRRLKPLRSANAPPLCRVMFGLQKAHAFAEVAQLMDHAPAAVEWGGLHAEHYPLAQQEGQFDLSLEIHEGATAFHCVLKYDEHLMSPAAAARFLRHYEQLLRGVCSDPGRPIDRYPLTDPDERRTLAEWSLGMPLAPAERTTYDRVFSATVAGHGTRIALVHGGRRWTYAELDRWVELAAEVLRAHGLSAGGRLVVCTRRTPVAPVCLLAALRCGAAYVPVAPDSPPARLTAILAECGPAAVVADDALCPLVREHVGGRVPVLSTGDLSARSPEPAGPPIAADAPTTTRPVHDTDAAYVLHTSGSSGTPKAVVVSHGALCLHVASMAGVYGMTATDRVLQFTELTFDPSIEQFLVAWSVGATVVMRGDSLPTGEEFWDLVERERLTVVNVPPSFFAVCTEHLRTCPELRLVIVGGDVFPAHLLPAWRHQQVRLVNAYGPTEAVITATTHDVVARTGVTRVPVGRPKPGARAWVLDATDEPAGIGVPGEICLGGPMLADGYLGPPDDGHGRFRMAAVAGGSAERIYRSGDLGRWTETGDLEFLGRLDRQIKIRGYRIEPAEIEAVLAEHPAVARAFVHARTEGDRMCLVAHVVPRPEAALDPAALTRFLKARVPPYMVPERVGILGSLPLNDAGKVVVDRLPPVPPPAVAMTGVRTPPRNEVERLMVTAWREVLQVEQVGIHDDYYDLGGGSLQSLRIVARLRELGVVRVDSAEALSPHLLFQYATIAELSPLLALATPPGPESPAAVTADCGECPP